MRNSAKLIPPHKFIALLTLILIGFTWAQVAAQSAAEQPWSEPFNLSQSGAVSSPQLLTDAAGNFHLFWQDELAGTAYVSGDGQEWGTPLYPRFPFAEPPFTTPDNSSFVEFYNPQLTIDANDRVHAIWRDGDNELRYSRSSVVDLATGADGWTFPVQVSDQAYQADLTVGVEGRIHISYLFPNTTTDFQPGVLHRFSDDGGATWSVPQPIYQSRYMRNVDPGSISMQIAAGAEENVYLVWENPLIDHLYLAQSADNGATWSEPQVVDRRLEEDPIAGQGPTRISLLAAGEAVYLTWQAEHEADLCGQYVQVSVDNGRNWSDPQRAFGSTACPADGQLFVNNEGAPFLFTRTAGAAHLQAFDGERWSNPLLQPALLSFTNPQTFISVAVTCHQFYVNDNNELFSLNCGEGMVSDIWVQSRPLGPLADWTDQFDPTPVWSAPQQFVRSSVGLRPPRLAADNRGRLHAVWSQTGNPLAETSLSGLPAQPGSTIYYARFDQGAEFWTSPRPIQDVPDGVKADNPDMVINDANTILLTWSGNEPPGIYFSRALADVATSQLEWEDPLMLPAPREGGEWPSIARGSGATVFVAYAIPANEERGIYLTRSDDNGLSWGEAVQVFDGASAGWQVVGEPQLSVAFDGALHIIWTQLAAPPEERSLSLAYARSVDGGASWSEVEIVTAGTVLNSGLLAVDSQVLHRMWTVLEDGRSQTRAQLSTDGGRSWNAPQRLSDPNFLPGATVLLQDGARRPLILQLGEEVNGPLQLREWVWADGRWLAGDRRLLDDNIVQIGAMAATFNPQQQLAVIFGGHILEEEELLLFDSLVFTARDWEADPADAPTPLPPPTATATMMPTSTPTVEPTPMPTPTLSPVVDPGPFTSNSSSLIVGVLVMAVLLVFGFLIGLRIIRAK